MPNPGFGNIGEEGILIELSAMNQITISEDKTVVSIGPGNRWSEVYGALDAHGTTVVGARIPQVGVSGLILGGVYNCISVGSPGKVPNRFDCRWYLIFHE